MAGYEGPLCQSCVDSKRFNFASMDCDECEDSTIVGRFFACAFYLLLILLLIKLFNLFLKENNFWTKRTEINICQVAIVDKNSNDVANDIQTLVHLFDYLKIFLNFLQLSFLLKDIEISWAHEIKNYLKLQFSISNFSEFFLIGECVFKGYDLSIKNIYLNSILIGTFPFLFFISMFLTGVFLCCIRRVWLTIIKKSILIGFYSFYVTVVYFMIRLVSCVEFEDQRKYLKFYLNYPCYDEDHNYYVDFLKYDTYKHIF